MLSCPIWHPMPAPLESAAAAAAAFPTLLHPQTAPVATPRHPPSSTLCREWASGQMHRWKCALQLAYPLLFSHPPPGLAAGPWGWSLAHETLQEQPEHGGRGGCLVHRLGARRGQTAKRAGHSRIRSCLCHH